MALFDFLSKIIPQKNTHQSEYFFALDIKNDFVTGSVWGLESNKLRIISLVNRKFNPEPTFPESSHTLTEAANIALDEALADFQPEPEKILFGVPDSWLTDDELKQKYATALKRLIKEIDVLPIAYVSSTHAICHYLQRQEGVPTTAILVEIGESLNVSVVKAGKVLASKEVTRGENIARDIEKILLSFPDIEVLPAKILIYGKGKMGHLKEELTSFNWMAQLPFLHLPKVEELEGEIGIKSLTFAGASEINPNVHLEHQTVPINPAPAKVQPMPKTISEDVYGTAFVEGDIASVKTGDKETQQSVDLYERSSIPGSKDLLSQKKNGLMDKISMPSIPKGMPDFGRLLSGSGFIFTIVGIILAVLVVGYIFFPKAEVTVFVDPRILEKETQIVADPKLTTSDEANKQIAGKVVETTVDGTAKAQATGKKPVGDPAKGTVVIYNKTASSKSFPSGTVLNGPNNLSFVLDNSVTVASQSAVEGGISFGKASANATASTIGPDGNLAAGKDLTLKGLSESEVSAKVDTAFSGGVSKDVIVVTSEDQKKLLASLTADLKKKAQEELQGKLTGDMKILEETFVEKVLKQAFTKNVGDQASELSLTLNVNLKGTAYSDTELKSIVGKLVETNVPDGFELDLARTETQASVAKVEKDGKIIFTAKYKAKLMPKLDLDKIKSEIKFKAPDEVEQILKSYPNVIGADIKSVPELPSPLLRLPILPQNINIVINSN